MTSVYVDLVNLDGSRPEGMLRFVLERMVLGDPDVVPSLVESKIRDGKARVDDLLPGAMRVRVSTGGWSKSWHITVPDEGEHDLFDLLEWQSEDFQETVWAALAKRVEALENAPAVDLAPLEGRVAALESKPDPERFDPSELQAQLAELRAHFTPVELTWLDGVADDFYPVYDRGAQVALTQHAGRVNLYVRATHELEGLLQDLDGLTLPHVPKMSMVSSLGLSQCDVELYQGAKFLTKFEPYQILLKDNDGTPQFQVAVDNVLAVVQETGTNRMTLSTFYYTNEPPPREEG